MLDGGDNSDTSPRPDGAPSLIVASAAPMLPVLAYAGLAAALGAFRLDIALGLGAAALLAVGAIRWEARRLSRSMARAAALIETRLDPGRPRPVRTPALDARLERGAALLVERVDALAARIERSALSDELTGLPNRRAVLPQLKGALAAARRSGEPFAVALVEIDRLKQLNGRLGDEFGDAVLRELADMLRSELRASDIAARWSGADFLLLFPSTTLDAAVHVVDRLRVLLADQPLARLDGEPVTISAGIAGFRITDLHSEEIVRRADEALESAKRHGRNRVTAMEGEWLRPA